MEQYLKSKLLLEEVELMVANSGCLYEQSSSCIVISKHSLTTLKNVYDFRNSLKPKYKKHPQLDKAGKSCYKELEFANYLRNIVSGHLGQDLLASLLKWRPELVDDLKNFDSSESFVHFYQMAMTYAFSSYLNKEGQHLYFKDETIAEIEYDFDNVRSFIIDTLESVKSYLQVVCSILKGDFHETLSTLSNDEMFFTAAEHTIEKLKA
ncbi:hypothetical protein VCHA54O482_50365 [Vibrio chagasii]|nr:hypothetical protein VCHA49P382_110007 [Vibrio chagasii]CAH7004702.1 hypothetical protein VCHA36O163_50363 [Vibrio chagasii]CAH7016962.1 hypothetical protein VCHA31O71_50365 [Vibrio chagasii]CAH7462414.1 hypothetical protein VCHA54O482_50365 [Vibrio chagasii]